MGSWGANSTTPRDETKTFALNLNQGAATYDLFTASGGDVELISMTFYVSVAGGGLTSVSVQDNDSVPTEYLSAAEGAVAGILSGKNLKSYATKKILASGKKVQYTIVGAGNAGTIKATVVYRPTIAGATIS